MAKFSLPQEILVSLDSVESALAAFEALTGQLGELPSALKDSKVQPLEKGRVNLTVAQALNSLVRAYVFSEGISGEDHPVHKEQVRGKLAEWQCGWVTAENADVQERVHLYGAKLEKVSNDFQGRARPALALDVAAAGRFIGHVHVPNVAFCRAAAGQGHCAPPVATLTNAVFKSVNEEILKRKREGEQH